jgi:hypothetical protein
VPNCYKVLVKKSETIATKKTYFKIKKQKENVKSALSDPLRWEDNHLPGFCEDFAFQATLLRVNTS